MAIDQRQIYPYLPKQHHRLAILLVGLILLAGGYFYWQNFYQKPQSPNPPPQSQRLEYQTTKVNHDPSTLPEEFPEALVLAQAATLESYSLVFTETQESKDGVLVMESGLKLDEAREYYKGLLQPPDYQLVKGSDAGDTPSRKILVYSTQTGIVIIKIEEKKPGSLITVTNSNILRGLVLQQN